MNRHGMIITTAGALLAAAGVHAGEVCGTWEIVSTPNPHPTINAFMDAVEMPDGSPVALGFGFILHWNGSGWDEIPYPDFSHLGNGNGIVSGIGTIPSGDLWGVGIIDTHDFQLAHALVTRYRDGEWDMIEAVPISHEVQFPFRPRSAHALAVAGAAADDVWVAGDSDADGSGQGGAGTILMLHWDGSEWTEHSPPTPGNLQNHVVKLAAVATDDVWAVGRVHGPRVRPLILHWDGSSWNNDPHPGEFMEFAHVHDIAVVAPDDIWLVGHGPNEPLFMHWNGSEWTVVAPPADATSIVAQRVVAIATDDVWALSADQPEFYHWDGASWSTVAAPAIPGYDDIDRGPGLVAAGPCDVWSFGGRWLDGRVTTLAERLQPSGGVEGDVDGDGLVNFGDLLLILGAWGPCDACPEDLNGDGAVNFADILVVLANWS